MGQRRKARRSAASLPPHLRASWTASWLSLITSTTCAGDGPIRWQSRNNHAAAQLLINLKIKRHLMLLQGVYQEILGPLFRYKLGIEVSVCAQTCGISYVVV